MLIRSFAERLSPIHAQLKQVWPNGRNPHCVPGDGPHYVLPGFERPVSLGRIEAATIKNVCHRLNVRSAFELGTGFGYSSFWIAEGMKSPDAWLGSLDDQSEGGLGSRGVDFARRAAEILGFGDRITYFSGHSPEAVGDMIGGRELDLAFIDGNHNGNQPILDYSAIRPHLSQSGIILWHDIESRYTVANAVIESIKDGWSIVTLPSSCRLGASYKLPEVFDGFIAAFRDAQREYDQGV